MTRAGLLGRSIKALVSACAWPGRVANWAVLLIMIFTLTSVAASQMRMGLIADWGTHLPLLGNRLALAGLTELQWHAFGVMVMLGGAFAYIGDRHVRVDIFYARFTDNQRRMIDVAGDLLLLIPFCIVIIYFSLGYVERSYITGERSDYGGLRDRFLIKAMIPIGLSLLMTVAVLRVVNNLAIVAGFMREPQDDAFGTEEEKTQ